jgi:N-acetylglucosamine kinase-like BadF-type ATPase
MFLGVDGGGTKTEYTLVAASGEVRARHVGPSVSHLSAGFERAGELLRSGINLTLAQAEVSASAVRFAFIGLPSYGEDSTATARLNALPGALFDADRYRCGNDMICSWAGALACRDGISVIAGTGSMAYGEYRGRAARAGGWGEIIGDEGSAYWIAREGMNLFSRMCDGRTARGPLYEHVRQRLGIAEDLDLCSHVYGEVANTRSVFAQFAPLVHEAALAGDQQAREIFTRAADELAQCVIAVRRSLQVQESVVLDVSHTGGVFGGASLLLQAFRAALERHATRLCYRAPLYAPAIGAALYAAGLAGTPLDQQALNSLTLTQ